MLVEIPAIFFFRSGCTKPLKISMENVFFLRFSKSLLLLKEHFGAYRKFLGGGGKGRNSHVFDVVNGKYAS